MKIFGCLLFSQSLVMHQRCQYKQIIDQKDVKILLEALIIATTFTIGILHFTRLNHFMPNWFRGEYELIAERVLNRNAIDLNIDTGSDSVYENQIVPTDTEFDEDHLYLPPSDGVSYLVNFFTFCDFVM